MESEKKIYETARALAARLLSVQTDDDVHALEAWLDEDPRNAQLLEKLISEEDFAVNERLLSQFPAEEGWRRIVRLLEERRPRRLRTARWLGYAAAVILVCAGAFFAYRAGRTVPADDTGTVAAVPAGRQGAVLTLGDGQVVNITPDEEFTLSETDGTVIRKDSAGINYIGSEAGQDAAVSNQIRTLTGMEYSLSLADGTRVFLNAESSIRYPAAFRGSKRVVELSGEAYFQVAKDADHPFVVRMQELELVVLGTTFNARSYENEQHVVATLVEGAVSVNGRRMEPGQQAVYSKSDGTLEFREVDVDQYVGWHEGYFVFRNERLEDMMKTLSRWYGIEYRFMDERVKDVRIGARFFRYENMDPIIDMLMRTELVDIRISDSVLLMSSK